MINIVPTSHIAKESLVNVRKALNNADCVCIELDSLRYHSMFHERPSNEGLSNGLLLWLFKKIQDWLGKKTGILPGTEMMEAIKLGKAKGLKVYLIDQDIRKTIARIKQMPGKEKLKLFSYLLITPIVIKFSRGEKIDLNKVPKEDFIEKAMTEFKNQFPYLYKVLVDERNIIMANNIEKIKDKYENIVVVVGAGHEKGLKKILKI